MHFGVFNVKVFKDIVLSNKQYVDLITEPTHTPTRPTTWDWSIRRTRSTSTTAKLELVSPTGNEFAKFEIPR